MSNTVEKELKTPGLKVRLQELCPSFSRESPSLVLFENEQNPEILKMKKVFRRVGSSWVPDLEWDSQFSGRTGALD
jgi:hypothetical protein